jgi:hypothetical protein
MTPFPGGRPNLEALTERSFVERLPIGLDETLSVGPGLTEPPGCLRTYTGPLTFVLATGRLRRTFVLGDACGRWRRSSLISRGPGFVVSLDHTGADMRGASLTFRPVGRSGRSQAYRLDVRRGRRLVDRIRWIVHYRFRSRRIYEGTRPFETVCVGGRHPLRRDRTGRLYCFVSGATGQRITVLY